MVRGLRLRLRARAIFVAGLVEDGAPTPDVDAQWLTGAPFRPRSQKAAREVAAASQLQR